MTETIYEQMKAETAFYLGDMARHPSASPTRRMVLLRTGDHVLAGHKAPWQTGVAVWS